MGGMIVEFRSALIAAFAQVIAEALPAFSVPKKSNTKGIERYRSSRAEPQGRVDIDLEFLSNKDRLYLVLRYEPSGSPGELARIDTFHRLPPQPSLRGGYWCEARKLPCMDDVTDEAWVPRPPSAVRFLRAMLATEAGREHLTSLPLDDESLNEALEKGETAKRATDEINDYLEYTSNPWREVRGVDRVTAEDIQFAVGQKIEPVVKLLASAGLAQFVQVLERRE